MASIDAVRLKLPRALKNSSAVLNINFLILGVGPLKSIKSREKSLGIL